MYVKGTDVASETCYNYDCGTTDISCPPKGLPVCPGGVNDCGPMPAYPDENYYMHKVPYKDKVDYHVETTTTTPLNFAMYLALPQKKRAHALLAVESRGRKTIKPAT
jgi:hypothetical protein